MARLALLEGGEASPFWQALWQMHLGDKGGSVIGPHYQALVFVVLSRTFNNLLYSARIEKTSLIPPTLANFFAPHNNGGVAGGGVHAIVIGCD